MEQEVVTRMEKPAYNRYAVGMGEIKNV